MSAVLTPAGGRSALSPPASTPAQSWRFRYVSVVEPSYGAPVPEQPPREVLLDLVISLDSDVVAIVAPDLDIAVEEKDVGQAFVAIIGAITEWLEYLRDEAPSLAPDLASQSRYVRLLDYDPGTWFGNAFSG